MNIAQFKEAALKHVKHYASDIDHDVDVMRAGRPVVVFVRECGSHSIILNPFEDYPSQGERIQYLFSKSTREHMLEEKSSILQCESVRHALAVFYFDGETVREIDYSRACGVVAEYQARMRAQFKKFSGLRVVA